MRAVAIPMILLMLSASFAGCTSGDPDGDGISGIDMEILNEMIDDNLQDFINNTSVTVVNNHYSNETHHTYNTYNGSSDHVQIIIAAGTSEGVSTTQGETSNHSDMVLLVRGDSFPENSAQGSWTSLSGAEVCVGIGTPTEASLVNAFSNVGISFTSVPVADTAEATAKFIDGSCDAMTGSRNVMDSKKAQLENETGNWTGVAIWITDAYGSQGEYFEIESRFEYTITQDYGMMVDFGHAIFEVTLSATCVQNCTSEDEDISHVFVFDRHPILSSAYTPSHSQYDVISDCDIEGYGELIYYTPNYDNNQGYTLLPGLDCTTTLSVHAHIWGENPNYEYTWSDWAYYLLWAESEVTMEE